MCRNFHDPKREILENFIDEDGSSMRVWCRDLKLFYEHFLSSAKMTKKSNNFNLLPAFTQSFKALAPKRYQFSANEIETISIT